METIKWILSFSLLALLAGGSWYVIWRVWACFLDDDGDGAIATVLTIAIIGIISFLLA